jgi:hypothetical protein
MPGLVVAGALTALALSCGGDPDHPERAVPVDLLTRIVMHESAGNPMAINLNKNGTTDYGLAQINSSNLGWLGQTPETILDPCTNIAAEARILRGFSGYATGSTERGFVLRPPGLKISYVESMADPRFQVPAGLPNPPPASSPPPRRRLQLITVSTRRR